MAPASAEPIALAGMMASGKSTVAAALGRLLHRPVVCTDAEVVRLAGKPIARIFAEDGEPAFRALERGVVASIAGPVVIDLGGGAFCDPESARHLLATARVVFLDVSEEEARRRMERRPPGTRPLADRWPALHVERRPLYLRAHHAVPVDGRSADELAHAIAELVR